MKITVLWNVTLCSPVRRYQNNGGTFCLTFQDTGSRALSDTGSNLPDYITSLPEDSNLQGLAYAVDLMEEWR
jgi:hypothetical protein